MIAKYRNLSLVLCCPGLLLQTTGIVFQSNPNLSPLLFFSGTVLVNVGLSYLALAKSRSAWWGLCGVLWMIGLCVVLDLKDRSANEAETAPAPSQASVGGIQLLNPSLTRLLRTTNDIAEEKLKSSDDFPPGYVYYDVNHQYELGTAQIDGQEGWDLLVSGLRAAASRVQIEAAAVYQNVRIQFNDQPEQVDAIHIVLEDIQGLAIQVFQMHHRDSSGGVIFGSVIVEKIHPLVLINPGTCS